MCETMANIPTEDRAPCVLTEDMFDAAMNQQFTYQDYIESEEESSSQEENMEVDQDTQGSSRDSSESAMVVDPPPSITNTTSSARENTSGDDCDSPGVSVLVIETGLDKRQEHSNSCEEIDTNSTPVGLANSLDNSVLNTSIDRSEDRNKQQDTSSDSNIIQDAVENRCDSSREKLPILKKILSSVEEPIDLCDSDSEDFSAEDELPGMELIDDELKSVMESNLMAEIGISASKQKAPVTVASKAVETSPPKIAVKSMAQVPSNIFNTLPQKKIHNGAPSKELDSSSTNTFNSSITSTTNINTMPDLSRQEKDEVPTTIHISKIAVPHQAFVNSQGKKMKCVYVRNSATLPVVINSNGSTANSKSPKYMMKKVHSKQVPPIVALSHMAIKNLNQKKTVVAKVPAKMLAIAPKLQKPPLLKNAPQGPHQFQFDQNLDSLVKSLLFHNLKKPYKPPPELAPSQATFLCTDCSDRFVLQSSLLQHLARRSLSIRYWCRICKVELQFFNRCVFLKHLRGHNCSIKNIDTTCITFSPLPQEMIESGVASSFLKDTNNDLPIKDRILQKNVKNRIQKEESANKFGNNIGSSEKSASSVTVLNPTNKKITTVASQTKSMCFQTKSSVLLNKPITSPTISSQSSQTVFPIVLPKKSQISAVGQNIQNLPKDQSVVVVNKQVANNVLLVCNPSAISGNVKQNTQVSATTSNVVSETEYRDVDDDVVVDDDTEKPNENNEEEEVDVENVTDNNLSLPAENEINQKTKSTAKSVTTSLRRLCCECGASCLNISKHLNGTNRPVNPKLACEVCKLILPTRCALKIHLRIHMKLSPHKCPDCGKDFDTWDDVNAHVKFSCGHLAKCVRYICLSCKAHFASAHNLGNHISSSHARDIYKCTSCPVAFFNRDSLNKHLTTIHPNEPVLGMDYKQCSMCPKKLVPIDKFASHVQDHTRHNNVMIYGYKCPLCFIVFANKMAFIIHQIKEKSEMEEKATATNMSKNNKYNNSIRDQDRSALDGVQDTNTVASDSNSDIEEEPVIVRKYPEPEDDSEPTEKDPLSLDGWEHPQEQRVYEQREELCIVCKKNSVILLPGIDLNNQSLCCKQCVKPLDVVDSRTHSNRTVIHYSHGRAFSPSNAARNGSDKIIKHKKSSPKAVQRSFSCDDVKTLNKKRKSSDHGSLESDSAINHPLDMMPARNKNRKKLYKDKTTVGKGQTHIQGQVVASKSPDELVCSKCEFVADRKETFLEHITVHRTDPNTFQCLECGLCFVVLPSLERHLQIHHGIKDVNIYTEINRSSLPQKVVSVEEETDDNQCRVCHEMFDSSSSLEKHFRSHGMAFMNSLSKSP